MSRQIYAVCLKCLFSLVLLFFIAGPARAQSTAAINGLVQDTSDALIPNAKVKLINTATGTESNSTTNRSGSFVLPNVMPGSYTLQIEREGFDTTQLTGITLNVGDNKSVVIRMKVGSTNETVTVDGSGLTINTTDASVGTVIDRKFVENIPLNGRSFQDLISMTPGVVTQSPQAGSATASNGDFSINGQRTESNYYTVDGVSGNSLGGNGYGSSGAGGSGSLPSATALGTTQSLLSVDALQEFRLQSSTYSAEYGRNPGGQISLVTRSGSNDYHGTAFDYLRNNFFDANDWFNDRYGKPISPLRQNDFGGTIGGPFTIPHLYNGKNKTFVFGSYEGLRLTQPQAASIQYVPDSYMRQQAPLAVQPILNAFPLQNGLDYGSSAAPSLAQFIAPYSLPSKIDSTSIRADQEVNQHLSIFFRYSYTPSSTSARLLSSLSTTSINNQTYTLGVTNSFSNKISNAFRLGYIRGDSVRNGTIDSFGGATPLDLTAAMAQGTFSSSYPIFLMFISGIGNTGVYYTENSSNRDRQWNLVDTVNVSTGRHQLKFGVDYRRVKSPTVPAAFQPEALSYSTTSVLTNAPDITIATNSLPATPLFDETALFAQDEWKVSETVNISLGIRWEINPPPTEAHGNDAYTVLGSLSNPQSLELAPRGTPLWKTSWFNLAPRLGLAWVAHRTPNWETVLRTGGGVFFDTNNENASLGYSGLGIQADKLYFGVPLPLLTAQVDFPVTASAPYNDVYAYPEHLQAPYTLQWNASLQQALGKPQTFTLSYIGANGRRLIGTQELNISSLNPLFENVAYPLSGITSNYQALQFEFQRTVVKGLQALASYTWSHSIDFGSNSDALTLTRGNSDFDVRNNFVGGVTWDIPTPNATSFVRTIFAQWATDARLMARTAFPVTLEGNYLTDPTNGSTYYGNLNLVPNTPLYLYGSQYPGGRAINPAAFTLPAANGVGDAPRNFVRGFGATQLNLAVRRTFPIHNQLALQFRAETFNVLNHPNFGYVDPMLSDATFGQATQMLNQSLGTLASQYQQGGPRSMQFALKILF